MKQYHATIIGDRFPIRTTVQASSYSTAASRALKQYQQRFKGKSIPGEISVKLIKGA